MEMKPIMWILEPTAQGEDRVVLQEHLGNLCEGQHDDALDYVVSGKAPDFEGHPSLDLSRISDH